MFSNILVDTHEMDSYMVNLACINLVPTYQILN